MDSASVLKVMEQIGIQVHDTKENNMRIGLGLSLGFGGVTSSFSPSQISGIQAWYRADLGVTQAANAVSSWLDQSGTGDANKNMTQGNAIHQPIFTASSSAFNNQSTIKGSAGALYLVSGTWSIPLSQPFSVFAVAQDHGGSGSWLFDSSAGGECSISAQSPGARLYAGSFGAINSDANPATAPCSLIGIFDSANTNSSLRISEHTAPAGASIGTNAPSPLQLLAFQGGSDTTSAWELAEIAFFSHALTTTEVDKLNSYANSRYNIVIGS